MKTAIWIGAALGTMAAGEAWALPGYVPISLASVANARLQDTWPTFTGIAYPTGELTLGGVPWTIASEGNNTWFAKRVDGFNPRSVTIAINQTNVRSVYTLMGTWQGTTNQSRYVDLTLTNSEGFSFTTRYFGGVQIRDWFNGSYTNSLNSWKTTRVYLHSDNKSRLDMQRIDLPPQFWWSTLVSLRIDDVGSDSSSPQRSFLYGLTVSKLVRCASDLNGDGQIDDADFLIFAQSYDVLDCTEPDMPVRCQADANRDGIVDDLDFATFLTAYDKVLCQ